MTLQIGVIGCGAIGGPYSQTDPHAVRRARRAVNDIDPQQARDAVTK